MFNQRRTIVIGIAALLTVGGCTSSGGEAPAPAPPQASCVPGELPTGTAGKLTVAAGEPALAPWFLAGQPASGEGFGSAVAYAVAGELGYGRDAVTWTRASTEQALAPGAKPFDIGVDRFAITEQSKAAVDFSAPYYLVRQAVVIRKSARIASPGTLAGLRRARVGARSDSAGWQAITQLLKPTTRAQGYASDADAAAALRAGRVDGIVLDLPAAFRLVEQIPGTAIGGQFAQVGAPQVYALLLAKDSPLTDCVSRAVSRLRDAGTLAELERRWMTEAGAPELR